MLEESSSKATGRYGDGCDSTSAMVMLWIPITLGAAASQSARTALQRHLKGRLSTNGAAFTRFVFGLPLAAIYVAALAGS